MKSTGIVRRIDDLGRVVIPKEIRRTLRIREGDPLEIYVDNSGDIIFKKYSVIKEIAPFASRYADVLSKKINMPVLVSDCDHIVAVSGALKKEFLERRITNFVEDLMSLRTHYSICETPKEKFFPIENLKEEAICAYPIICCGDVIGSICVIKPQKIKLSELDISKLTEKINLTEITAQFLAKHFED